MNLKELDIKTLKSHARQVNIKIRQEHKEETKAKVKEMRKETSEKIKEFKAKRTEELKAKLIPLNRQGKKAMIDHLEPHKDKIGHNIKMTVTEADDEGELTKDYGKSEKKPYKGKVMSVKGIPTESEIDRLWEESKKAPVPPEISKQDFVKVAKSKPTVKPLHKCDKCGKGSYTKTCVACMRKELAAEDKKNAVKVPSIKITEAEDEGEKDKETKSTQEPYKGKVKKIKGIPKDPEKIKEKYAKKEGGGKPPSEPQEYITIYKNGKPVRMRRRDKKPKEEEAPAEAVDEAKAARIEAEKKKRALRQAETEAKLAAKNERRKDIINAKKVKKDPKKLLAASLKKDKRIGKLIDKVIELDMSAKDLERFEKVRDKYESGEADFDRDYSLLQRIKNKARKPKDNAKADSPAPTPTPEPVEQGPRNLKKGFGIKRLPKDEAPQPKKRQYIPQFDENDQIRNLVDKAYPKLKKKEQREKFGSMRVHFGNVREENSTEKEILEEELNNDSEREIFKYLIKNNKFIGAEEYNKKKNKENKEKQKFDSEFQKDRSKLKEYNITGGASISDYNMDFHNA